MYDDRGRLLGIADAWFDEVALTWEINSYAWHLNPESYAREITRTADMTAATHGASGAADRAPPRPGGVDGDARRRLRSGGTATATPGAGHHAPSIDRSLM